jgi:hypothetical protein
LTARIQLIGIAGSEVDRADYGCVPLEYGRQRFGVGNVNGGRPDTRQRSDFAGIAGNCRDLVAAR